MEVEENHEINDIFNYLIQNKGICFKTQQRDEADFTDEEKLTIVKEIYIKNKASFLLRFGKYMMREQLDIFTPTTINSEEDEEVKLILANLRRAYCDTNSGLKTKNRRYEALKQLIAEDSYFSEVEMMKRNPLLYEQLVGQYLNDEERRQRDRANEQHHTLVNILLEGMERDEAFDRKKQQLEDENNAMEESDSDEDDAPGTPKAPPPPKPSTSRWGEFAELQDHIIGKNGLITSTQKFITMQERQLLRNEFTSIMYANFLNGHDDFDYTTVDNNDAYDNIEIIGHDEEDKYFDSEEPENALMDCENKQVEPESSEDELDIYMSALNQHPTVMQLSKDLQNL